MVELAGHSEGLNDIVWLHGHNNFVATASDDKTIKLWDIEKVLYKTLDIANNRFSFNITLQGISVSTLSGHQSFVFCLAIHPDENILLSGGEDETVKMWDIRCGSSHIYNVDAHAEPVTSVAFNPTGSEFVTSSYDGMLRVWSTANGSCLVTVVPQNVAAVYVNILCIILLHMYILSACSSL